MSVELEARVRRANLITRDRHLERLYDDDLSRRLLRDIYSKKEGRMTDTTDRPQPVPVPDAWIGKPSVPTRIRRASAAWGVASLVIVLAIGAIVAQVNRGPDLATAVGVAEAYMVAINEHDVDTVLSMLADDAVVESDWDATTLTDLPARIEFERIIGMTYHWDACIEDAPGQVRCPYQGSNHLSRALGVGLSGANRFEFTIEDGMIEHVANFESEGLQSEARVAETIEPFEAWVLENHPEDYGRVFSPPLWRAQPMALWEEYVPEFVASVTGSG